MVFNNSLPGGSAAWEIELPLDASMRFVLPPGGTFGPVGPVWAAPAPATSIIVSNAERLPNGNTLICSGGPGEISEVTPTGREVWRQSTGFEVFHAHYVQRSFWTDAEEISLTPGGSVGFDLIAGTPHAGEVYLVLGSASGTTPGTPIGGHVLPLQFDGYFVLTLSQPNVFPFSQTLGTLDARGRANASFALPPGLRALAGLHFDHAYVLIDPLSGSVTRASNAVPLDLTL